MPLPRIDVGQRAKQSIIASMAWSLSSVRKLDFQ